MSVPIRRVALHYTRHSHERTVSLHVGQTLTGQKGRYLLTQALSPQVHRSAVFKAELLLGLASPAAAAERYVLVKAYTQQSMRSFKRERNSYKDLAGSGVTASFRRLLDFVGGAGDRGHGGRDDATGPPCLVFEWFDSTLANLDPKEQRLNHAALKAVFGGCLKGLALMAEENLIHTDLQADNILLSGVNSGAPIAKIRDLGSVTQEGANGWWTQPAAIRAPEVWQGFRCTQLSEVWALAAAVLVWLRPDILGTGGIKDGMSEPAWCMAKLMALFPGWRDLPAADAAIKAEVTRARGLLPASQDTGKPRNKEDVEAITKDREGESPPPEKGYPSDRITPEGFEREFNSGKNISGVQSDRITLEDFEREFILEKSVSGVRDVPDIRQEDIKAEQATISNARPKQPNPSSNEPKAIHINLRPLDEELRDMGISEELADFLQYLLVVDPKKRPTASEALASKEFQALAQKGSREAIAVRHLQQRQAQNKKGSPLPIPDRPLARLADLRRRS